jgi:aspartate carbamoyltransferase catalytic subunit
MRLGHIVSAGQFTKKQVMEIFGAVQEMEGIFAQGKRQTILSEKKGIGIIFDEPSTGTRNCIESAIDLLGGSIITATYSAEIDLSIAKGETFAHTVRRICAQSPSLGALFIRCKEPAWLEQAVAEAEPYGVKVVNCGNGAKEHPTQALSDLYTIWRHRNKNIDGLTTVYAPTVLYSRVFNSHVGLFPIYCPSLRMIIVGSDNFQIDNSQLSKIAGRGIDVKTAMSLTDSVRDADVLYLIRLQRERHGFPNLTEELQRELSYYILSRPVIEALPEDSVVMHALPIDHEIQEIPAELEKHPKVICFTEQLRSKTLIMMVLLKMILG